MGDKEDAEEIKKLVGDINKQQAEAGRDTTVPEPTDADEER